MVLQQHELGLKADWIESGYSTCLLVNAETRQDMPDWTTAFTSTPKTWRRDSEDGNSPAGEGESWDSG